ncbi:MAG: hypothetical protein ACOCRX_08725 [Candidatus Woesearchaeota archaeon]
MEERVKEFVAKIRKFGMGIKGQKVGIFLNGEKLIDEATFDVTYNSHNDTIDFWKLFKEPVCYETEIIYSIIITKNYELKITFTNDEILLIVPKWF